MAFEKVRLEFVIDKEKHRVNEAIISIGDFIHRHYGPSSVHDVDCGEVSTDELVDEWGFTPDEVSDGRD